MAENENTNLENAPGGKAAGGENHAPMADGNPQGEFDAIPAGTGADGIAAQYAAKPASKGGRPRLDGLQPGSPEARAADAGKPRRRKPASPAGPSVDAPIRDLEPLPSLAPSPGGDHPTPGGPVGSPATAEAGAVPWRAESLTSTVELALGAIQSGRVKKRRARLERANLPPESIAEMGKDLEWPSKAVDILNRAGAQALADGLNHFNVDARFQKYAEIPVALAMIVAHEKAADARVTKILAAAGIKEEKPGAKKPAAV